MISVEEADQILALHRFHFGAEAVPLHASLSRILREPVWADRDFPPFDRVSMDGIAISFETMASGRKAFPIEGRALAGSPQATLTDHRGCIEVMTGAPLPLNADTVIRYEDLDIQAHTANLKQADIRLRQNIHHQGIDARQGDLLLAPGQRISAAEIATLATVGKSEVIVSRNPRMAILSTGDELVPVEATPLPHQIRASNAYAIRAIFAEKGIAADLFFCRDEQVSLDKSVKEILADYDIILLSGGVSAGRTDYVPDILAAAGVEKHFHRVAQRPGKPMWFGTKGAGKAVFALPGNPVSVFLCTCRYVLPWLRASLGDSATLPERALLAVPFSFPPKLTLFLPVKLENRSGHLHAHPLPGHGSGDLANLNGADAFLELPGAREVFEAGEAFDLIRFR